MKSRDLVTHRIGDRILVGVTELALTYEADAF
jgi:hypothetical protein